MKHAPSRLLKAAALAVGLLAGASVLAQTAICYNCPPEWADWASQLRAIKDKIGITVPPDNKNSGQTLAQLVAEKASPVADMAYYGVTFGIQAKKDGVTAAYKPAGWADIPDGLKDPEGHWFTIHSGTLGFMVNVDALKGKPVPRSWADLLKPDVYKRQALHLAGTGTAELPAVGAFECLIEQEAVQEGRMRRIHAHFVGLQPVARPEALEGKAVAGRRTKTIQCRQHRWRIRFRPEVGEDDPGRHLQRVSTLRCV